MSEAKKNKVCFSLIGCIYPINCTRLGECIHAKVVKMNNKTEEEEQEPIDKFKSGAATSGNKPPYECLTLELLTRAALRMKKGMRYGKHNWKKGSLDKEFIVDRLNHAIEHLIKAQAGIENDFYLYGDDDLAAVVVNCMFAMEYQKEMMNRGARQENADIKPKTTKR